MAKKMRGFLLYRGAIPTEPDVNALMEQIGVPEEGSQISYDQITKVIGVDRKTSRWHSVVSAWRKELLDNNGIVLKAIANEGFDVLTDNGKAGAVMEYVGRARNAFRRADKVARRVNPAKLADDKRAAFDHYGKIRATLELAEKTAAKAVEYPELDRGTGN